MRHGTDRKAAGSCLVAYSGGKDSHLALLAAIEQGLDVKALVYFDGGRLNTGFFHDHSRTDLIKMHGELAGLPVEVLRISRSFGADREANTASLMAACCRKYGASTVYCGATAEDDNTGAMRTCAAARGIELKAPLAATGFEGVLRACAGLGVKAMIIGVEKSKNIKSWLGRLAGPSLAAYAGRRRRSGRSVDGNDFQTVVLGSPLFRRPIRPLSFADLDAGDHFFRAITGFTAD